MPINAEGAVDNAVGFANTHGYPFVRVVSVRKIGLNWEVRLDVGAFHTEYKLVRIDSNGTIIGFSR